MVGCITHAGSVGNVAPTGHASDDPQEDPIDTMVRFREGTT
jgi:hypothetical protein